MSDKQQIERLHSDVTDRINDMLIPFQDASYELGRKKGQQESQGAWLALGELVSALESTNWSSWQTTASFDEQLANARAALAKARGES